MAMAMAAALIFPRCHEAALMFPKRKSVLYPNTYAFESEPMVKPAGFANNR
jgi:hypothetical protein